MTDRERLICLLSEYDFDSTFCDICERPDDDCAICGSERLADYLIAHGVVAIPFDFCPKCGRLLESIK